MGAVPGAGGATFLRAKLYSSANVGLGSFVEVGFKKLCLLYKWGLIVNKVKVMNSSKRQEGRGERGNARIYHIELFPEAASPTNSVVHSPSSFADS